MKCERSSIATYELVPSTDKEKAWNRFISELDTTFSLSMSTAERLKCIHRILTDSYELTPGVISPRLIREFEWSLYCLDRSDGERIQASLQDMLPYDLETRERIPAHEIHCYEDENMRARVGDGFIGSGYRLLLALCRENTVIDLDVQISGKVRTYGSRRISNEEEERVFPAHTCVFSETREALEKGGQGMMIYDMIAYYGLSKGIEEMYDAVCTKYDELISQAKDLDDVLLAEAFLQIVGTRVIHPFWDGNGRTFGAHLARTLHHNGVQGMRDYKTQMKFVPGLSAMSNIFLEGHKDVSAYFLKDIGLSLVSGGIANARMSLDHGYRTEYMVKLRNGIEKLIDEGVNQDATYLDCIAQSAWQIKRVLLMEGLLEPCEKDRKRLEFEADILTENGVAEPERYQYTIFIPLRTVKEKFG